MSRRHQEIVSLLRDIVTILKEIRTVSTNVDAAVLELQADVTAETTVQQSAITLLNGIPALIATAVAAATAAGATPAQLAAFDTLSATMVSNATGLAAAVTANTPAAPAASRR